MFSAFKAVAVLGLASCALAADLRVCADPDNLPYSNSREQGFENELARLVAGQLGLTVHYTWIPQRERYFQALAAGACDVAMEVPAGMPGVLATRPYYRSAYVFVSQRARNLGIHSFDEPVLKTLRIGVQVIGADDATAPPTAALVSRGMLRNVTWYRLYNNYLTMNHPAAPIEAVEKGNIDVAIAWGPLAGYFARSARVPLTISAVSPQFDGPAPFAFDISIGLRPDEKVLSSRIDKIIDLHGAEIRAILLRYGVPLVARPAERSTNR